MGVRQQALGHAHRQERNAALFHQIADRLVGLGVGSALAEDDQRAFGVFQHIERTPDRARGRDLRRGRVDHLDQRPGAGLCIHQLGKKFGRQVEIDAAGTSRDGGADRARQADADVGGVQHAEGRLAQRFCDRQLVHLFIVALLQIDDLALGRSRDQDHREAVRGGIGQRRQAVEKARRRHRQADAGFFGQEAGDCRRIAGVLLVPERDDADAFGLRHPAEIRDRDAGNAVDGGDAVELERIDDEMKAIGLLARCVGSGAIAINALYHRGHSASSLMIS
jgi:hypothetical protein